MTNTSFTVESELPATSRDAYELLTNEQAIRDSYAGRPDVLVTVNASSTGHHIFVSRPVGPQWLGRGLQLNLTQRWQSAGDRYEAQVKYELLGSGVSISGRMQLQPQATGSLLSAHLKAVSTLPFVGKPLASKLAGIAKTKVEGDFAWQRETFSRS